MIFLAVDYGLERVGLAFSDPDEKLAFPAGQIDLASQGSRKAVLDKIVAIAREKNAAAIVLGLPLAENGEDSLTTRQVRNAAQRIARRAGLPLYQMPEFLSSFEAAGDLRACGIGRRKAKNYLDQQAACRILQSFLDQPAAKRRPM